MTDSDDTNPNWNEIARVNPDGFSEALIDDASTYGTEGNVGAFKELCHRLIRTDQIDTTLEDYIGTGRYDEPDIITAHTILNKTVFDTASKERILNALHDEQKLYDTVDSTLENIAPKTTITDIIPAFCVAAAQANQADAIEVLFSDTSFTQTIMHTLDPPEGGFGEFVTKTLGGASGKSDYYPIEFAVVMHKTRQQLAPFPDAQQKMPEADEHEERYANAQTTKRVYFATYPHAHSPETNMDEVIEDLQNFTPDQAKQLGRSFAHQLARQVTPLPGPPHQAPAIDIDALASEHLTSDAKAAFISGIFTYKPEDNHAYVAAMQETFPSFRTQIDITARSQNENKRGGRQ